MRRNSMIPEGRAFGFGPEGNITNGLTTDFYERFRVGDCAWLPTDYMGSRTWEACVILDVGSHPVPEGSPAGSREQVELNVAWLWKASDVAAKFPRQVDALHLPVPIDDAQRDRWYYLTDWTQNVWADTITTHAEFVLGAAPVPDPLHHGAVRILGFMHTTKRDHLPKQYTPIVQGTDLFALLAAAVGKKTTLRDARYHDLQQLWRTGVFGAPQAAEPFDKVALDVIGLSRVDASKGAVVMMGADARAGVIHGLVYVGDDGAERRGFAVGRTAAGALRVRALYTVADLLGCESAATSSEQLKKAARAARTICARPGKKRHWFLYDGDDVELIVGVDEVEVPVARVRSPILVVSPSYLPFLLGECAESRLHVFELGVGGDDGLAPYPHPSLERRLEAIPELVFGTDGARPACSVARPRARAACSSARDRVCRRAAPTRPSRRRRRCRRLRGRARADQGSGPRARRERTADAVPGQDFDRHERARHVHAERVDRPRGADGPRAAPPRRRVRRRRRLGRHRPRRYAAPHPALPVRRLGAHTRPPSIRHRPSRPQA